MNMLEAMRDTISLMDERLETVASGYDPDDVRHFEMLQPDLKPEHLRDMLHVMESGVNSQDTEAGFSEGKMGRWLGWAQAAVVAMNLSSLDEMKEINKKWASRAVEDAAERADLP